MEATISLGLETALAGATSAADRGLVLLRAAIAEYAREDLSLVDNEELLAHIAPLHVEAQRVQAVWLDRVAEADRREAASEVEGAPSTASWLRHSCRVPGPLAAAAVRVGRRLPNLPSTAEALHEGRIGLDVARLFARELTQERFSAAERKGLDPAEIEAALVNLATVAEPVTVRDAVNAFTQMVDPAPTTSDVRDNKEESVLYASRTLDDVVHTTGRFNAVDGAALLAALDAAAAPIGPEDKRSPAQRRAAALIELLTRALDAGELPANGGERPHVGLLVPYETLAGESAAAFNADTGSADAAADDALLDVLDFDPPGEADGSAGSVAGCGHLDRLLGELAARGCATSMAWLTQTGPVSPQAARLLACDSIVHRIVLGPDSIPLDVGRAARIVPAPIRRALLVRDRGCAFPTCDRPASWCQAHHIKHWSDGGETSLDNCVLLCRFHHRLMHHTGWDVHAVPGGRPYFTRPDGTRVETPQLPGPG